MHRLDRIRVAGFKSIREMDLELRPLNVLIGANGSGKSNFVSVFSMLNNMVEGRLQAFVARSGGADTLLHFGQKRTPEMVISLSFGPNGWSAKLAPSADDGLFFEEESCSFHDRRSPQPLKVFLGSAHLETKLPGEVAFKRIAGNVLDSLRSWRVYHFHDTSASAKVKQLGDIDDNAVLRPDAANLAAFLFMLRDAHPAHYETIVRTVRMVAPFFSDFSLRPHPANEDKIRLEWSERGTDAYFNAHALSDGTLRFVCLSTLLLQPNLPATILIDEPELGLHPYAIQLLASLLKSAAHKTQVIASTQSVTLLNQFDPEDVIVVDREDEQSVFRRPGPEQIAGWIDAYSLGDLWEKNVIGGRPSPVVGAVR
jgi:predicted ATPase